MSVFTDIFFDQKIFLRNFIYLVDNNQDVWYYIFRVG